MALAIAFVSASPVYAANDNLTVNTGTVLNTVTSPWLGVNYVAFWDSIQGSAKSREAWRNAGVDIIRFPGGAPGDWINWSNPYGGGSSSTSTMDLWNYAQGVGANVKLMLQTNPTANVDVGESVPNDSSGTHAADWVTYCKNNNIAVPYWEIGNEADIELVNDYDWAAYQWYLDKFGEQAAAMKARDSSIKILGNVGTNTWYWWGLHSLDMFLQTHGNRTGTGLVDAVSVHCYDCPTRSTWSDVIANAQNWQGRMDYIKSVILANDTRDLPVFVTETSGALGPGSPGSMASLMARALGDADWIGALRNSGVKGITLFGCIHNVTRNWGLLYGSGERGPSGGEDSPTPGYYVLPIWTKVGNTVVQVNGLTDPAQTLSAYASTKAGSVQVVAINKTSAARSVGVSFVGFDPTGKGVAIYELRPQSGGTSNTSAYYNGVLMPDPGAASLPDPATDTCIGSTYTRTVPAYSITLLDFSAAIPSAPSGLSATAASSNQINLTWTDNSNNEDGFRIERKTGAGGTYAQIAQVAAGVTSYQNTGLSATTTYYYRVRAYNAVGNSAYSNEASATTPGATVPSAPSGLSATAASSNQINLTWTDNSNNEDGFRIERKTGAGGTYAEIATVGAGVTTYQNTGLAASTTYYYRVRAYNAAGNSSYSNEANATTTPSSGGTMHVSSIPNGAQKGKNPGRWAYIYIVDNAGAPVVGATVTATFNGWDNGTQSNVIETKSAATGSDGSVRFQSVVDTGSMCVDNVTHSTLTYDSGQNVVTCVSW
jgi:hypothetical protein